MGMALVMKHVVSYCQRSVKVMLYFRSLHSKRCLTSCTLLTRCSTSVLKVAYKEDYFGSKQLLKNFITKVLEYIAKAEELKFLCIAVFHIVMSVYMTSLNTTTIH